MENLTFLQESAGLFCKNRQAWADEPMNRPLGRQGSFTAA
jgi:hypothetical protein